MSIQLSETIANRLVVEQIIWLTTVRAGSVPTPTPVWFLWDGETFVIFTQPGSQKLRNIAQNPTVALNFNTDEWGGSVAVFTGTAEVENKLPSAQMDAYLMKYAEGIKMIGMTPERMAAEYSTFIRITPSRVRTLE
ncbi:MAG: TIGR03667 family PPOX class F420-dependent oxidoreductase [Anaerolineales bacterium]|nr:TIGR03667 family PPOX class F420-dependent oxidoreductase [Anaerolineales bacterium]